MSNRWLIALLIVSWLLIVMLGVALYLRTVYPVGGYWLDNKSEPQIPRAPMYMKRRWSNEFKDIAMPIHMQSMEIIHELHEIYVQDQLDTTKWAELADSLAILKGELHRRFVMLLVDLHPTLTPEERNELFARLMLKFGPPHPHRGSKGQRGRRVPPPDLPPSDF